MPRFALHLLLSLLLLLSQQSGIAEVMAHPDLQFATHSNSCNQFEQDIDRQMPDVLATDSDQLDDVEHLCIGFISKKFDILVLLNPHDFAPASSQLSHAAPAPQSYQSRAPPAFH